MALMSTCVVGMVAGHEGDKARESMDWCAWLSKTRLDRAQVYEYAVVFARNELEEEDIADFDHEFLVSMGVSVAKHRLEILKLARDESRRRWRWQLGQPRPVARLFAAAEGTRQCMARHLCWMPPGMGTDGEGLSSKALVPVRRKNPSFVLGGGGQWGCWKLPAALKQGRLLLTDGKARARWRSPPPAATSAWYTRCANRKDKVGDSGVETEVRWDSMFKDLKPT